MTPSDFVDRLSLLMPQLTDVLNLGFNLNESKKIIGNYKCIKRDAARNLSVEHNSILSLIQLFDCSSLEIGLIRFSKSIVEETDFYHFGEFEVDLLVVNKITHEVEVREYLSNENILWKCASNADNFLEAVLFCAGFISQKIKNPSLANDTVKIYETAKLCSDAAGGEKYIDFYKILLGYDE